MAQEFYMPEELRRKKERRKIRKWICLALAVLFAAFLTGSAVRERQAEEKLHAVQEKLSEEVFRFHVLANSDSGEDQSMKMEVREAVLTYMEEGLATSGSALETKEWARAHLAEIEETAAEAVLAAGGSYPVRAEVTRCEFPQKSYGDVTFPAGQYDALRIEIGEAKGHNWWCVLYPGLCFIDAVHAVVPEEGKEKLQAVLDEEEYEMVTMGTEFKIKWFFFGD